MSTKIAFDVSGLAWGYRSGVQNLIWSFIDAYAKKPDYIKNCDITFYDRSGIFNQKIFQTLHSQYQSCVPRGFPKQLRRPLQAMIKVGLIPNPSLKNYINQVWNWDIFNPIDALGSITIPDILPLEYPQWFSTRFRKQTEHAIEFSARQASFINCISYDVQNKLATYAGINPAKIKVIYPGISPAYFLPISVQEQNQVLNKFNLDKDSYLISSGFLDPRKNLKRQIEAFRLYIQREKTSLRYVLTGLKTNLSYEVLNLLDSVDLRDRVIFLGYVSAQDLRILTSAAAGLMYCSIAEGFGLPIIESMALGVPVITSNNTSMKELAMGRAILVHPESIESIADGIGFLMNQTQVDRQKQILLNQEYTQAFTIDRWLKEHIEHMVNGS